MPYRDPDTGRFITRERWENFERERIEEFEDWNMDDFSDLGEEELY